MFKCQLMSVNQAIKNKLYGEIDMSNYQEQLEKIFPQGVCNYNQRGSGRPLDL